MWKTKIIFILIVLLLGEPVWAGAKAYLPKADLIKGSGPEVYLLENGIRYWIPDIETFNAFNFKWSNLKIYADEAVENYPLGDNWRKSNNYPEGALVKGSGPAVYLIELGKKRWIPSPRIFESNDFGWKYILFISDKELERIKSGDNLVFNEPNRYPETIILSGPAQGTILATAQFEFKFSGTNPLGSNSDLTFETFLKGYDTRWQRQSRDTETYNLSDQESEVYTFYVRAKNKEGYYDFSPVQRSFQVGVSPYYQKVEIRKVEPDQEDFKNDYLILRNNAREKIDITDWKIKTEKGDIKISRATARLRTPSNDDKSRIELNYQDEVIISSNRNANGVNFRVNQCTGYLTQAAEYFPDLDENCPELEKTEYSHLKKACRDFIDDLDRCQLPDYTNNFAVSADSQCTQFLNEHFNYNQCYLDHYQEMDFF
ncbi:MAG: hypothetical protein ABIF84_00290, partial [Patescibacteria group bacterium]